MRGTRTKVLLSVAIAAVLVYVVFRQIDVGLTMQAIAGARRTDLLIAFLFLVAAYAARAGRWLVWDRALGYWNSAAAVLVGFMGNNVLPARLREVFRADWIASRSPTTFGRTSTLASIAVERVLDGTILSLFAILALSATRVGPGVYASVLLITLLFGVLTVALTFSVAREGAVRRMLEWLNRFFPGHLTRFAKEKLHFALDGIVRLRGAGRISGAVGFTITIWLLELGCYYFVAAAIYPIPLAATAVFVTVVNFASLFPFTVGGIGAIEGAATAFLVGIGIPADQALAMVVVQHGFQLAFTTIGGGAVYVLDSRRAKAAVAAPAVPPAPKHQDVIARTLSTLDLLKADLSLSPADRPAILLSVVIPAYNELQRLPRTALETIRWCNLQPVPYEIIIADDGSTDDTLGVAELLGSHDQNVRTIACPHKGKGAAVRMGMLNARGKYVLFMDADGATPLTEIPRLLVEIERGADVAIGSRVLQLPGEVEVKTSLHRRLMGRVFAFFVNVFAISGIADTQCGFKMFRREVVKDVFSRQKLDGFAFDVEILFIARRLGLSISEVPVNWTNQEGSKVSLVKDSLKMLWDLTHIRWLHRRAPDAAQSVRRGLNERETSAAIAARIC